ncbi:hypothetical protein V6N12_073684 [Hibiscus sabdariffa]|uniref:DUF4283 domain-containing protein n=1 Tax=Hibiscus sabdariffa TaxID=183260 RepID=A0ABR2CVP7_9ROSI
MMIGVFDAAAVVTLNNPRKYRRFDKEPPDRGGPGNRPSQSDVVVDADGILIPPSYKDSLLYGSGIVPGGEEFDEDDDIDILEGEVIRSTIDGLISIEFFDRIQKLAAKSLDQTLVIKLLGRRIGYSTLQNKLLDLWKPQHAFRLMDIDNDYFLVTFKDHSDFLHVLADGPWTVFGHYLTVEPWTSDFSSSNPFPSTVWTWIRLPGLHATLYKRSLITAIGECIGPIVKIDHQTDSGRQGRFACLAVKVDLRKPLVSKIIINGVVQIIKYESLPSVCFLCGLFGHTQDSCSDIVHHQHPTPVNDLP